MILTKSENVLWLKRNCLVKDVDLWRGNFIEYYFPIEVKGGYSIEIRKGKITKRYPSVKAGLFTGYEVIDEEGNPTRIKRYHVAKLISRE